MDYMTSEQENKCHAIIHTASVAAAGVGAGLAQLPGSDNAGLLPIQAAMLVSLGLVFDISISKSVVVAVLENAAARYVGRAVSQFLVGWIPVIGNGINATTAAALTEAMGWSAAKLFAKEAQGGNASVGFDELDQAIKNAKKTYESMKFFL